MVDEYHKVSVNRISPEFPMPIMCSPKNEPTWKPGGVANVAHQLRFFNTSPQLYCFTDNLLSFTLSEAELYTNYTRHIEGYGNVPVKRRFLDGHVQVVRWDTESHNYGLSDLKLAEFQDKIKQLLLSNSSFHRTAVLSDYNKGFFSGDDNWIQYLPDSYTIVDPKAAPLSRWRGCDIFKPNYKEAVDLSGGITNWKTQARFFKKELGCQAVVITCGGEGVKGIWGDDLFEYCTDQTVKVLSVVGAGDCFCAGLALAVSQDFTGLEAIEVAYEMGAQYVQHDLNRPITPSELSKDKIVDPEDLAKRDFKLSFTNGCFDILHEGHLNTLRFAKSKAEKLVVALNTDESIKRLKGEDRPIKKLEQRAAIMAAFEFVDFVVCFDEDTPAEVLEKIKPDVLVKGSQYELEKIVGADTVKEVYRAPMVDGVSTTALIGR